MTFARFNSKIFKRYLLCTLCLSIFLVLVILVFDRTSNTEILLTNQSIEEANSTISRNTTAYVLPNKKTTILLPKRICKKSSSLLIIVTSSPNHFEKRRTIRETWGSDKNISNFTTEVYFIIGKTYNATLQNEIEEEYKTEDDIVQEDFIDSYANLTVKSLMMLKVIKTYCLNKTTYFMKTDDDMYVNMVPLVNVLINSRKTDVLFGHKYVAPIPKRDPNNKWYVPLSVYGEEYYPNFLSGSGYVMSTDVVHNLFHAAFSIPIYFLEDVYITGMLARAAGVEPENITGFTPHKEEFDPCAYLITITSHGYTRDEMLDQYATIKNSNLRKLCEKQSQSILSKLFSFIV